MLYLEPVSMVMVRLSFLLPCETSAILEARIFTFESETASSSKLFTVS